MPGRRKNPRRSKDPSPPAILGPDGKPIAGSRPEGIGIIARAQIEFSTSSLIPDSEALAAYDQLVPGAAHRIIKMAEAQNRHRLKMEDRALAFEIQRSYLGLVAAIVVALSILGCGTFLIHDGHDNAGAIVIGIDMVSIVGAFLYGTNSRRKERVEKIGMMMNGKK